MKKKREKDNLLIIFAVVCLAIVVFVLISFVSFTSKKSEDKFLEGELGTFKSVGEESAREFVLREASMHSGVSPIEESEGYILELKSEPFFKNRAGGIAYKEKIREEHIFLKQQIEQNLQKTMGKDIELLGEFEDAFNGVALDISEQECEFLKRRIDIIKECY